MAIFSFILRSMTAALCYLIRAEWFEKSDTYETHEQWTFHVCLLHASRCDVFWRDQKWISQICELLASWSWLNALRHPIHGFEYNIKIYSSQLFFFQWEIASQSYTTSIPIQSKILQNYFVWLMEMRTVPTKMSNLALTINWKLYVLCLWASSHRGCASLVLFLFPNF